MKPFKIAGALLLLLILSNSAWATQVTYGNEDYNVTATLVDWYYIAWPWKGRKIYHKQHQGVRAEGFNAETHVASVTTWLGNYDYAYHWPGTAYPTRTDGVYDFEETMLIRMFGTDLFTKTYSKTQLHPGQSGNVLKMTTQIKSKAIPITVVLGGVPFKILSGFSSDFTFEAKLNVPGIKGPNNTIQQLNIDHSFEPSFTVKGFATMGPAIGFHKWTIAEAGAEANLVLLEGKTNRGFVFESDENNFRTYINESAELNTLKGQIVLYAQTGLSTVSLRPYEVELVNFGDGFSLKKWQKKLPELTGTKP